MTEIERKALALAIETRVDDRYRLCPDPTLTFGLWEALCRAIEQHEAFKQEVSDALLVYQKADGLAERSLTWDALTRFIIAKPVDPLVDILADAFWDIFAIPQKAAEAACEAIEKRGGKIVWGEKQ